VPTDQTSQNIRKMKISLLLVVATLALVCAEQSKLWNIFKEMVMKTEGDQKHELMQIKKIEMKVKNTADPADGRNLLTLVQLTRWRWR
jgi:hypothetical protein